MITKYGFDVVIKIIIVLLIVNVVVWLAVDPRSIRISVLALSGFFFAFTLNFFRDPERKTPAGDNLIVSPADGKVVQIKEVDEPEFLKSRAKQVSIFMSPLDVHVNRFPMSGIVRYYRYIPGRYVVAFEEKSSEANERTHIGIEHGAYKVLFKQIAGFIARRIVANINVGMDAFAGERFGMIRFGSRVDVLVPMNAEVNVQLNDRVVAGETALAHFKSQD